PGAAHAGARGRPATWRGGVVAGGGARAGAGRARLAADDRRAPGRGDGAAVAAGAARVLRRRALAGFPAGRTAAAGWRRTPTPAGACRPAAAPGRVARHPAALPEGLTHS